MNKNEFHVYLNNFKKDVEVKAKNALWRISDFVRDHQELTVFATVVGTRMIKHVISDYKVTKEHKKNASRYYDPRTGHYWYLKKVPNVKQQLEIERRYRRGESYGQIFMDLGLL